MTRIVLSAATILAAFSLQAQNVTIPDANFKAYLVGNSAINTNADNEIQVSEAQAFTSTIDCNSRSIASLTGIEAFTALTGLNCNNNQLTSLDVSANTALIQLRCENNQLTSLDVSANTALQNFTCTGNQLTAIDVSANTALLDFRCADNQLTTVDVSTNTALDVFNCYTNQLTSINLNTNTAITFLNVSDNALTSLDLSANTALQILRCNDNLLTSLDLSNNSAIGSIRAQNNRLTSVNLANGNSNYIGTLNIYGNPDLACIQVNDSVYSTTNWLNGNAIDEDPFVYDSTVVFSENCANIVAVNQSLSDNPQISVYPNPTKNNINFSAPAHAQITNITGQILIQQQNTNSLDLSALPAGVYFLTLQNQNGRTLQVNKILKE